MGKFHHDLTVLPNGGNMVNKGNDPQMAQQFRLVKYDNLPRIMIVTQLFFFGTIVIMIVTIINSIVVSIILPATTMNTKSQNNNDHCIYNNE